MSRRAFEKTGSTYTRLRRKRIYEIPHLLYPNSLGGSIPSLPPAGSRSVGFFGSGRGYKGLHNLLDAFDSLPPSYRLRVVVNSGSEALRRHLVQVRESDPRIDVDFEFLSHADLEKVIRDVDLIVLPFDRILNSGSVIQTLSLGRPVLVPSTVTFEEIGRRTGDGWVNTYSGPLRAGDIEVALTRRRDPLDLAWCADETLHDAVVEMLTHLP
ncbi:hypothetical protein [uncultured Jatrophihabitans sp.]|uniref:hypothetical protein n=1 Tax=uncultured Jatrophihabitans sp. TaxID=1610747 RepID=UPI0035CC53FA